jgi:hypothetical protein
VVVDVRIRAGAASCQGLWDPANPLGVRRSEAAMLGERALIFLCSPRGQGELRRGRQSSRQTTCVWSESTLVPTAVNPDGQHGPRSSSGRTPSRGRSASPVAALLGRLLPRLHRGRTPGPRRCTERRRRPRRGSRAGRPSPWPGRTRRRARRGAGCFPRLWRGSPRRCGKRGMAQRSARPLPVSFPTRYSFKVTWSLWALRMPPDWMPTLPRSLYANGARSSSSRET